MLLVLLEQSRGQITACNRTETMHEQEKDSHSELDRTIYGLYSMDVMMCVRLDQHRFLDVAPTVDLFFSLKLVKRAAEDTRSGFRYSQKIVHK
jgi:hypothetical protein